jgi:hypothetical protein
MRFRHSGQMGAMPVDEFIRSIDQHFSSYCRAIDLLHIHHTPPIQNSSSRRIWSTQEKKTTLKKLRYAGEAPTIFCTDAHHHVLFWNVSPNSSL